jgi:hypothetical protein
MELYSDSFVPALLKDLTPLVGFQWIVLIISFFFPVGTVSRYSSPLLYLFFDPLHPQHSGDQGQSIAMSNVNLHLTRIRAERGSFQTVRAVDRYVTRQKLRHRDQCGLSVRYI